MLEPPEEAVCAEQGYLLLKGTGAVTQAMMVIQQRGLRGRATPGSKILNPAQVRARKVQLPVLSSTGGGQHGGCHTEKGEEWENHREGKRPGKQMLM